MDQEVYHIPALLVPTIQGLDIHPDGIYVDCTYGGGGHSTAISSHLTTSHLYAFDQDLEAIQRAESNPKVTLIHGNFRYLQNYLRFYRVMPGTVDGILADLGVSFHHFDDAERGFSFRYDGPLDMRMNQSSLKTAARLIAESTEEQLADILYIYGELKNSRRLASAIIKANTKQPVQRIEQLIKAVRPLINPKQEKKEMAQIFQALRIAVNDEMASLKALLEQSLKMLKPGGRLAIITYHSLEDRLVKNFMKTGNFEGRPDKDFYGRVNCPLKLINNKPIVPDEAEIENNPRSRSAKLRIAEKV